MKIRVVGDAAFVPLTKRYSHLPQRFTLVDIEDVDRVAQTKWYAANGGKRLYAHATNIKRLAKHHALLHAYILRVEPGQRVDHISGDSLDNRKQNLRLITASQNAQNARRPTFPGKTSRFKGVCWSRTEGRWRARITLNGASEDIGAFDDEEAAARAYDEAALRLFGEYARTNAEQKLYEMTDPFVPDCSWAQTYVKQVQTPHRHLLHPTSYARRLDFRVKNEIKAARAT